MNMSARASQLFVSYVTVLRWQTEGSGEEKEAKETCILLRERLEQSFGHVEHEIIADEIEAELARASHGVRRINPDRRPKMCRERLREEGRPYPRSGCFHCETGGLTGCAYELRDPLPTPPHTGKE